jgi:hypothetical protein
MLNQVLETSLNRKRDFRGNLKKISNKMSYGYGRSLGLDCVGNNAFLTSFFSFFFFLFLFFNLFSGGLIPRRILRISLFILKFVYA